jgi:hypothetical protein
MLPMTRDRRKGCQGRRKTVHGHVARLDPGGRGRGARPGARRPGPGGIKRGKFAGLTLEEGGVVGRKQYTVTILAGGPQTDDGESDYS